MINWRSFFALAALGFLSAAALIPVVVAQGEAGLAAAPLDWGLAAATVMTGAMLVYPAAIYVGLRNGAVLGLAAPLIEAWVAGRTAEGASERLGMGLAAGLGLGLLQVAAVVALGGADDAAIAVAAGLLPVWTGLAQAVNAGIGDEILFRFGLMTLLAWFAGKVLTPRDGGPSRFAMWFAVAASAALYGAIQGGGFGGTVDQDIPQAIRLLAGTGFGWLFWKHGLESAITANFVYHMLLFQGSLLTL